MEIASRTYHDARSRTVLASPWYRQRHGENRETDNPEHEAHQRRGEPWPR